MKILNRWRRVFYAVVLFPLLLASLPAAFGQSVVAPGEDSASGPGRAHAGRGYFDVREDSAKKDKLVSDKYAKKPDRSRKDKLDNRGQQIKAARAALADNVADPDVVINDDVSAAEIVGVKHGAKGKFLAAPAGDSNEKTVRGFLSRNASLYGLSARQIAQLRKTADYANPAGNAAWVELRQEIKGVPVFQGELRALMTKDGELARTVGRLVPSIDDSDAMDSPADSLSVGPAQAVALAASALGVSLDAGNLVVKESSDDGHSFVFDRGPFDDDIKVELVYFPLEAGTVTPAWAMTLWQSDPAFYTVVDADGGDLLWQKNITDQQTQPATYAYYSGDSPAPMSPSSVLPGMGTQAPAVPRTTFTIISEHTADNLGWLTDGVNTTTGNNVDAGLDLTSPNGIDTGGRPVPTAFRVFDFAFNPAPGVTGQPGSSAPTDANYRWGAVTNLFVWTNRYHDRLYDLGFTEAGRNFQQNNFGRGGLGNDFVRAEAQDCSLCSPASSNNANFSTPPDGSLPRMQMYIWPGTSPARDGDLDQEIILHELTHGTSNRLHANASGLGTTIARGMGEGWSDFYARSILSSADEDVDGIYAFGAYATHLATTNYTNNYYYGIRRFPYAVKTNVGANGRPHNPMTLADTNVNAIDLTDGAFVRGPFGSGGRFGAIEVHNVGEIWTMALLEVRARVIKRLGYTVGNQRMLQLVTDAMRLDPVNPTLIDGRNSLLAADAASYNNEDEFDIWDGFAARGMGYGATMAATNVNGIESFDRPSPGMGSVTFVDASCNANGAADPGEDLYLSIPLTNMLHSAVSGVTLSVNGQSASYGTLAPGQTVTQQVLYTVPSDATCGNEITVPVVVNSSLGSQTKSYKLRIGGTAIVTFSENFDGVAAPALPSGWSALVNPTGSPVWRTVNTSTQSAPNAAFVTFASTTSLSFLQSPVIPISTTTARLQFRHSYNSEFEWDGGMIQISLDGGTTYGDILDSGPGARMIDGGFTFALHTTNEGNTNALQARAAWTGNSAGFVTTTIQLPTTAAGKSIRLRFIGGADSADTPAGAGWTIDDVKIIENYTCAAANCSADLSVAQTATPASVNTNSNVTYSVTVANNGPARATDAVVTDSVPSGMSFQSATAPSGWSAVTPAVNGTGAVTFTKSSVDAGETAVFQIVLRAECGITDGTSISNTATVSGSRPDANSANNSAVASITALDPAPVINAPANILQAADPGMASAVVVYTATVTDNCGGATLASSHPSGTAFPIGTTLVTLTATDSTGNVSHATFTVAVSDTQAPAITGESVSTATLWPPQHQMVDVTVNYTAGDNSGLVTTALTVSSNEPENGLGDGDTGPDWQIVNNHLVRLRAERSGTGSGRVYTITITATDASGNVTTKTVIVRVPKSQNG